MPKESVERLDGPAAFVAGTIKRFHQMLAHPVIPSVVRDPVDSVLEEVRLVDDVEMRTAIWRTSIFTQPGIVTITEMLPDRFDILVIDKDHTKSGEGEILLRKGYLGTRLGSKFLHELLAEVVSYAAVKVETRSVSEIDDSSMKTIPYLGKEELLRKLESLKQAMFGDSSPAKAEDFMLTTKGFRSFYTEIPTGRKFPLDKEQKSLELARTALMQAIFEAGLFLLQGQGRGNMYDQFEIALEKFRVHAKSMRLLYQIEFEALYFIDEYKLRGKDWVTQLLTQLATQDIDEFIDSLSLQEQRRFELLLKEVANDPRRKWLG